MNKTHRAILYGLAIGDGHISYRQRLKDNKYRYEQAELIIGHGPKQKEYLEYKADLLLSIFGGKHPKVSRTTHTLKSNCKTYEGFRVAKTNRYFRQMHKNLYTRDKKKFISKKVLNFLDPHSLALWFMDDGFINHNKNKSGVVTSVNLRISTQCSEQECLNIQEWLKEKYAIEVKYFKSKNFWDIGCGTRDTIKFIDLILDHIHNSMFYKIRPLAKLVICKSAKHPNYKVDDDIVRSVQNKMGRNAERG